MDKYNYEMTKYPNIYKNCYWGLIKYDILNDPQIINNRNKFIEEFNIITKIVYCPKYIYTEFKEFELLGKYKECYLTNNKDYILVNHTSNYDNNYNLLEWNKYDNLYNFNTSTYIKVIRMKY